jgi:hypothetical protein
LLQIFKYATCFGQTDHIQVHNFVSRSCNVTASTATVTMLYMCLLRYYLADVRYIINVLLIELVAVYEDTHFVVEIWPEGGQEISQVNFDY